MATPLQEYFQLLEDPFDPSNDPSQTPPFSFAGRSLRAALKIHECAALEQYFAKIGSFATECARAETFLQAWNGVAQGPPAALVYGPAHGGLESMACYVAGEIKKASPPGFPTPLFQELPLLDDSLLSFLTQLDMIMRFHVDSSGVPGCAPVFAIGAAREPSVAGLTQMFTLLAGKLTTAPWLVLQIGRIVYRCRDLVIKTFDLLTKIKVAPIYMTSDPDLLRHFSSWKPGRVLKVEVTPLNASDGLLLLKERLAKFRDPRAALSSPYHPYMQNEVQRLFADGDQPIGSVLDRYDGALRDKLAQMHPAANPSIGWASIAGNFKKQLQDAVPPKKGT